MEPRRHNQGRPVFSLLAATDGIEVNEPDVALLIGLAVAVDCRDGSGPPVLIDEPPDTGALTRLLTAKL